MLAPWCSVCEVGVLVVVVLLRVLLVPHAVCDASTFSKLTLLVLLV